MPNSMDLKIPMKFTNIQAKKKCSTHSLFLRIPSEWLSLTDIHRYLSLTTEFQDIAEEFKFLHPAHRKAFAVILHRSKSVKEWFILRDTYTPSPGSSKHQIELFITTDETFWNISSNLKKREVLLKNDTWFRAKELFDKIVENKEKQIFREVVSEEEKLSTDRFIQIWSYHHNALEDSLSELEFHLEMRYQTHKNNEPTEIHKAVIELMNALLEEADSRVRPTVSLHRPIGGSGFD